MAEKKNPNWNLLLLWCGGPVKHGYRLSIEKDFTLSKEKIGDYYILIRRVLTNILVTREVLTYVTTTEKDGVQEPVFQHHISRTATVFLYMAEKVPLNQTGNS